MKLNIIKISFSFLILILSHNTYAQWGVKAGINYNSNGELKEIPDNAENIIHGSGDKSAGYHIGIIRKIDLPIMFIKPELVFTKTKSSYDSEGDFEMSKLDLPIVLGIKMVGPLHVLAGPSFQYLLSSKLDGIKAEDIQNDISMGLHFGIGAELGKLGIDIRYERGFTNNEIKIFNIDQSNFNVDSRPEQLIFSLFYKFE